MSRHYDLTVTTSLATLTLLQLKEKVESNYLIVCE